jgi:hypothetical protein
MTATTIPNTASTGVDSTAKMLDFTPSVEVESRVH